MPQRKAFLFFIILSAAGAVFASDTTFALENIEFNTAFGLTVQKGSTSFRAVPNLSLRLGYLFSDRFQAVLSASSGAFFGSQKEIRAEAWFTPWPDSYAGRAGLSLGVDWGDFLFYSTESLDFPPSPMVSIWLLLEPLRFKYKNWTWSVLAFRAGTGLLRPGKEFLFAADLLTLGMVFK